MNSITFLFIRLEDLDWSIGCITTLSPGISIKLLLSTISMKSDRCHHLSVKTFMCWMVNHQASPPTRLAWPDTPNAFIASRPEKAKVKTPPSCIIFIIIFGRTPSPLSANFFFRSAFKDFAVKNDSWAPF